MSVSDLLIPLVTRCLYVLGYIIVVVFAIYLGRRHFNKKVNRIPIFFAISMLPPVILQITQYIIFKIRYWNFQFITIEHHFDIFLNKQIVVLGMWAVIYYITPKLTKKALIDKLSLLHFWVTQILIYVLHACLYLNELAPRRYYTFKGQDPFRFFDYINPIITVAAILFLAAQVIFVVNLIYSLIKKANIHESD